MKNIAIFIGLFTTLSLANINQTHAFEYWQALPDEPLVPKSNPLTAEKTALGKWLFYRTDLSRTKSLSCNSCHNLLIGGNDGKSFSVGLDRKTTKRSTPNLWNIGLQTVLYWDGRSKSLEHQSEDHLQDKAIMAMTNEILIKRFASNSQFMALFNSAFPTEKIGLNTISKALASFERRLMAANSPFDKYIQGDKSALSTLAIRGMETFNNSGCLACHFGVNFAGPAPGPAMGLGDGFYELFPTALGSKYDKQYNLLDDKGLYEFSGQKGEIYMWRVPSLRNIELSPPYFHNGSAKTLRDAIRVMGKVQFQKDLSDTDIDEIAAFLRSLTGQRPPILD